MSCRASEIAALLGAHLHGADIAVTAPRSLAAIEPGALVFAKALTPERLAALNACAGALALVTPEFEGALREPYIVVANPRLAFARAVARFFAIEEEASIAATAVIDATATLGTGVSVGAYSVIGAGVVLGDGTRVRAHAVIGAGTRIGRGCLVKSHVVIGEEGFGFEIDEQGTPVRIPHVGAVEIGDEVEIGAGSIIARGTLDPTRIGHRVKIDDMVFIAHNASIGDDSLVIANAEVSGRATIGKGCWIGPSVSLINGVTVGDRAFVGIGAVVLKDVAPGAVVVGNPARFLRMRDE